MLKSFRWLILDESREFFRSALAHVDRADKALLGTDRTADA